MRMKKPEHHLFVCAGFRAGGGAQGACAKKGSMPLMGHLESELSDRGIDTIAVSMTGCLKMCDKGPVMVVYPQGDWYGEVDEQKIDSLLDALEAGGISNEGKIA
jgi:(2Fe-2S) ferredoxin